MLETDAGVDLSNMDIYNRRDVTELLGSYGLAPNKSFGQNFLLSRSISNQIAQSAYDGLKDKSGKTYVIEIGPGIGALTKQLAQIFDSVTAVEIDGGMVRILESTLAENDNVKVINNDILKVDLLSVIREMTGLEGCSSFDNVAVCSNLPYYITTPIIMRFIDEYALTGNRLFSSMTVMIQSEVADRLTSSAGDDDYGAITASISLSAAVKKVLTVGKDNFHPVPGVSSEVISVIPYDSIREVYPEFDDVKADEHVFAGAVKKNIARAFEKRRKTLINCLSPAYEKDRIREVLSALGYREDIRGEKLSAYDYCRITAALDFGKI